MTSEKKLCPKCREIKHRKEFVCNRGTALYWCADCFYTLGWTQNLSVRDTEEETQKDNRTSYERNRKKRYDAIREEERQHLIRKAKN